MNIDLAHALVDLSHHAHATGILHAGEGLLDTAEEKNTQFQNLLRGFAVTAGIGFIIWQGIQSRGAMARIFLAIIAAGIFIWGVWSVIDVKDRVSNEFESAPAVVHATEVSPDGLLV